jgi:ABC-type sugar transport system permease subunit
MSLYAYQNYFRYLDFGYGSAVAVQGVVLIALLAATLSWLARGTGRNAT